MGALDKLPEHWKSQKAADAVMAPSAIVLAGLGAAGAILGGLPALAVLGIGAIFYGGRVVSLLPRKKGGAVRIDPMTIGDPWRGFVRGALDAQRRYRNAVASATEGPMRDRLIEIGERIDAGVDECWRIARRGDALNDAISNLDVPQAQVDLENAKRASRDDANDPTVQSLVAQLDSARGVVEAADHTREKLRLLDARLDVAVARAVELSIRADDVGELGGLGSQVEDVVSDMETLRVSLEEAAGTARAAGAGG
jgi:hypothetical protein